MMFLLIFEESTQVTKSSMFLYQGSISWTSQCIGNIAYLVTRNAESVMTSVPTRTWIYD